METVLLVVHLMLVAALIGLVLVQRSEGGALGIGGGGNFMANRGSGNVLTRTTTYLAAGFFVTSLTLTILAGANNGPASILDDALINVPTEGGPARPEGGILDLIRPQTDIPAAPAVPNDAGPAVVPGPDAAPAVTPAPAVVPNEAAPAGEPAITPPVVPN
jgi:preprotein translocase subunit SecG